MRECANCPWAVYPTLYPGKLYCPVFNKYRSMDAKCIDESYAP